MTRNVEIWLLSVDGFGHGSINGKAAMEVVLCDNVDF